MNTSLFASHSFELSDTELAQFEKFLELFMTYNSHTNLSAIRDAEGIVEKHFVDSLYGVSALSSDSPPDKGELEGVTQRRIHNTAPQEYFQDSLRETRGVTHPNLPLSGKRGYKKTIRLLDIGSGGGFPGIPLKIVMPELQITLLDSVGKKVKAMNHFVSELGLTGISAIQERAEVLAKNLDHAGQYDFVVSRATAYMTEILTWAEPFLAPDGRIILYKMPSEDEQKEIRKISKKLGLILEGELTYELGGKERILYTFVRR